MGRVMTANARNLIDVPVAELTDDELRPAFKAHFAKLEEMRLAQSPYRDALEQIIARLGQGQVIADCRDCGRPLFHHDQYLYYSADRTFACAPACPEKPAPAVGVDLASGTDIAIETMIKDGKVISFKHRFATVRK